MVAKKKSTPTNNPSKSGKKSGKSIDSSKDKTNDRVICQNKKAYHNYFISDVMEAGIVLKGSEVKSLRAGKAHLLNSYARIIKGELFLLNAHITPLEEADKFSTLAPDRARKLLIHKRELAKLEIKTQEQGINLIPTKMYLTRGKVKVAIGIAKPKKLYDKRETLKERAVQKDIDRAKKGA